MTAPDPGTLEKRDVNPFDRFASDYYSKKLSTYSDNTKDAVTVVMALSLLPHLRAVGRTKIENLLTDIAMFLEAQTLVVGMTKCAKGLSERPRPYVYNTDLPLGKRRRRVSFESFWSGHASLSFTTAVFSGYVFQNRHPESSLVMPVWIAGIGCATATSILRVASGNHFPSDVIVGAAVGSFIGWLVPSMHREGNVSFTVETEIDNRRGLGVTYIF